jgi:AAA family ATP:ADP antiporter
MIDRFLQVRKGERTRTALLFLYLFLVVGSYVVTKSTRDALFLGRFSASRLPLADMASAAAVAAVMAVYLRLGPRGSVRTTLTRTLLAFSASSIAFWALSVWSDPPWLLPVLYIWAGIYGVLLPAQVWTLANCVMTTREAKRLVGIIGSGAICGWIGGGLLTRAAATRIGTPTLLLTTGIAIGLCPILVHAIWRDRRIDLEPGADAQVEASPAQRGGLLASATTVWRSPYLRAIAAVIGMSSLVTTIAAWQFRAIARQNIADTDALTAFFGSFNVYAGVLSLATQLFLTSRLLRRWGIGITLLIVPFALTAGSAGVLVWGGLFSAVVLKGGDQVLRYSVDRSAIELLYLPVPTRQMFHAKAFIDAVVWRLGDWTGSVAVLLAVGLFGATVSSISFVTLALLIVWAGAAIVATRGYVDNLRRSIQTHRLDNDRMQAALLDRSASDLLAGALQSGATPDILYALGLLADRETPEPMPAVRPLVDHADPAVRRKAIALLAAARDADAIKSVEARLADEDADVRAEALMYLTRVTDVDPLARIADLQEMEGPSVGSAMALYLARPGPAQNLDAVRLLLQGALGRTGPDGVEARRQAATMMISMGALAAEFLPELKTLLNDPALDVARLALRVAGTTGAVAALGAVLDDTDRPSELRADVPAVLQRIATPEAEQVLVENLLDRDPLVRLKVVAALNALRQLHPERRLERELIETLVAAEILGHYRSYQVLGSLIASGNIERAAALKDELVGEVERVFRLMALLFPDEDMQSVFVGLRSGTPTVRANAIEFLDHALPAQIRDVLLPLVDPEVSIDERVTIADRMIGAPLAEEPADVAALQRDAEARLGVS